jgi:aminomethyltransferase
LSRPSTRISFAATDVYDFHTKAGAKLVDFAGWEMPILYRGIADEHNYTRNSGGLFDVSHMGRIQFKGKDVLKFLEQICTRDLSKCEVGQAKYSLICNEAGGVLDDVIVGRDTKNWIMVVNASNREKVMAHFRKVRSAHDFDVDINDQTEATAMVALQGPKVIEKLAGALGDEVTQLKRYHFYTGSMFLIGYTFFRTGYTGEDGVEMIFSARAASMVISKLAGRFDRDEATIKPAGLGARDTLRLEAGMPLYGHELGEDVDPISAGLGWAVGLDKEFIGAPALRKISEAGPERKLVGLEIDGKRIARQGSEVKDASGNAIGIVTSGTMSPTLQKSIAMAYVSAGNAEVGTKVGIDLRGEILPAAVTKLPFYKRA